VKTYATITLIGKDKSGLVAKTTNFLFEAGANIEALEEQVTRGQFSMIVQASWGREVPKEEVTNGLQALAQSSGLTAHIRFSKRLGQQKFALFVTKEEHCPRAVLKAVNAKAIKATPAVVIGNHPDLRGLAEEYRVKFHYIPWEDRGLAEKQSTEICVNEGVDFIVLARFMKILSPTFVWQFKNRIINIHPSLLPSFPGPQPYRQAYEHGVKMVGVTAHFVSMHLDEGPIIAQDAFRVKTGMSLKEIIAEGQKLESKVLVRAVQLYLRKRLDVFWGIVKEV
jgi:formyltetrahydrofolate deformylase